MELVEVAEQTPTRFFTTVELHGSPVQAAEAARDAIRAHEVVHLKPIGVSADPVQLRKYYDLLVEAIGEPVDIAEDFTQGGAPTGERWSEIRYDPAIPDMAAFRYSKNAQPMHTDESYVSSAAGVMLFYCVNTAPAGGETTFISGKKLVEVLSQDRPELLDQLVTTNVRYEKATDFKDRPIIRVSENGAVDLNFNFYCVAQDQGNAELKLNQDFFDYLQSELSAEFIQPVGLQPGEGVTWRDDLVLHGRNAFHAQEDGDRWIWKTGLILPAAA